MAAANFSRDVLEMFYGSIEDKQSLPDPIRPTIMGDFEIVRTNFNKWFHVWGMEPTNNNNDLFKFFEKQKKTIINICEREVEELKSIKIQFALNVSFYDPNDEWAEMRHYFGRMAPVILNEHNIEITNNLINEFIDKVKGEIESWSERGSG